MTPRQPPDSENRVTVEISRELEEIVPIFLANRKKDLRTLRDALAAQDFRTIQTLGHRMKGDGGGFGFDRVTEIGSAMEAAASQHDQRTTEQQIRQLEEFLNQVVVIYR